MGAAYVALALPGQAQASDMGAQGAFLLAGAAPVTRDKSLYHPAPTDGTPQMSGEERSHNHSADDYIPQEELLKIRAAAESGDADAMGELGEFYHEGRGVERDLRKAFYWLREGAAGGNLRSMLYLGRYYRGEFPQLGLAKDLDEAEKWLLEVARTDDRQGMLQLSAVLFERARNGQPERRQEANWWYNRATGGDWDPDYVPPALREDGEGAATAAAGTGTEE